jgi:hypothetical protein
MERYEALILTKHALGDILGDFFTNSLGHPVCKSPKRQKIDEFGHPDLRL